MKKIFLKSFSVFLAIIMLLGQSQSLSAKTINASLPSIDESVFNLDKALLNEAMQDLNELEAYLEQNEGLTYSDLTVSGSELILNVSDNSMPFGMEQGDDDLLGIPPFLWGCVLGWVGLLLVYILTDNDKALVKKALTGCLVGTGVSVLLYVVYIAWIVTEVDPYY
jgi:hypothetical protein